MIRTVKDLKEIIQNLPDDMAVMGYKGDNGDLYVVTHWLISDESVIYNEEYPKGALVISVD